MTAIYDIKQTAVLLVSKVTYDMLVDALYTLACIPAYHAIRMIFIAGTVICSEVIKNNVIVVRIKYPKLVVAFAGDAHCLRTFVQHIDMAAVTICRLRIN